MRISSKSKSFTRVFITFILILSAGFLGIWWLGSQDESVKVQNNSEKLAKPNLGAKNQTDEDIFSKFGGSTPLNTIMLFVSALEKGDLALASKYFSSSIRDEELHGLTKLKETGYLDQMITILKKSQNGVLVDDNHWRLEITTEDGESGSVEIELEKNEFGRWKITSL